MRLAVFANSLALAEFIIKAWCLAAMTKSTGFFMVDIVCMVYLNLYSVVLQERKKLRKGWWINSTLFKRSESMLSPDSYTK